MVDDLELEEEMEELGRRLDEAFQGESGHKDRFLTAIAEYLKRLPAGALLSDIPMHEITRMYDRTGN
jgi:hypothetical protein